MPHRGACPVAGHQPLALIAHRRPHAVHFLAVEGHIGLAAVAALQHIHLDMRAVMIAAGLLAAIRYILYSTGNRRHLEYFESAQGHCRRGADGSTQEKAKKD